MLIKLCILLIFSNLMLRNKNHISMHNLHYLNDVNIEMEDCTLIGDKAYLNQEVQLDLCTTSNIVLEVPMR